MNATVAINDGDTHNGPSEQVEAKYPLLVERYTLRRIAAGPDAFAAALAPSRSCRRGTTSASIRKWTG